MIWIINDILPGNMNCIPTRFIQMAPPYPIHSWQPTNPPAHFVDNEGFFCGPKYIKRKGPKSAHAKSSYLVILSSQCRMFPTQSLLWAKRRMFSGTHFQLYRDGVIPRRRWLIVSNQGVPSLSDNERGKGSAARWQGCAGE